MRCLLINSRKRRKLTGVLVREKCEVKLPEHPLDVSRMTAAQLDAELEKGYADAEAGRTIPMG